MQRLLIAAALISLVAGCSGRKGNCYEESTLPQPRAMSSRSTGTVVIGRPGDRWLDAMQYQVVARSSRDNQFGYEVTYQIPGAADITLFWSRDQIDFCGALPGARQKTVPLGNGLLHYPEKVTQESLPDVYQAIQLIENGYARDANGMITATEAFALVASLGMGTPAPRAPPPAAPRVSVTSAAKPASVRSVSAGASSTQAVKAKLLKELAAQGIKHTPENVIAIERISGRIVFLEVGNARAGFTHIIERHGVDFARRGIAEPQIPEVLMTALSKGRIVGKQGARPVYEVMFNGQTQRIAITVGDNGFIVGANPAAF